MSIVAPDFDPDTDTFEKTLEKARAVYAEAIEGWEREAAEERAAGKPEPEPAWVDYAYGIRSTTHGWVDGRLRLLDQPKYGIRFQRFLDLEDFTHRMWPGTIQRGKPTHDTLALEFYADEGGPPFEPAAAEFGPDEPHCWMLFEDTSRQRGRVPKEIVNDEAFARQYRESHRSLHGRAIAVFAEPGRQVTFALWSPEALTEEQTRQLARELSGDAEEPRFRAVAYPYKLPTMHGIYIPADVVVTKKLSDRQTQAVAITGHPTGIAALDAILSGGYLPSDALVGIGGAYGQCKTTLALELLENLAAEPGSLNVLLAVDEPATAIRARRLQRRGLSREAARAAVGTPLEAELTAGTDLSIVMAEPGELFEDFIAQVLAEADGRQVNLGIDSIQKLQTRAGAGKEAKARVSAASQAVRAAVLAGSLRIVFTSEVVRSGTLKDSSSLGFDADLIILSTMNRAEDGLTLAVHKNRYGDKATLAVGLDRAGQRLCAAAAGGTAKPAKSEADTLKAKVWAVLRDHGTATGNAIVEAIGGRRKAVLALLRVWRDAGQLAYGPDGYSIAPGGE